MKNVSSVFPNDIDPRVCFSDCDLQHVPVMEQYTKLINQGQYTSALNLLISSDADYFGSWILNLLENRLKNMEEYMATEEKPDLVRYVVGKPNKENIHWVGELNYE